MQFSDARWRVDRSAPLVGQHNAEILRDLLGFSDEEIATMVEEAAI